MLKNPNKAMTELLGVLGRIATGVEALAERAGAINYQCIHIHETSYMRCLNSTTKGCGEYCEKHSRKKS